MVTTTQLKHVLIGTAGHIDHGKTRLVGRLTGIETDRLPEEKVRGISIDLGFAHWTSDAPHPAAALTDGRSDQVGEASASGLPHTQIGSCRFQFGVVDVPGHERFVKNMVAGATGINLALLVVAADDGVMQQTREHLEIMDLLGVRVGVVAITKIDLVEPDFVELVQAEIVELVAGTFLEGCPIICVSSETGAGLDELKTALTQVASEVEWSESQDLFRMPVDRVFSITGQGSIVTGSVLSGEVRAGDVLELLPERRAIRVRSVQNHGVDAEDSRVRQRTAINPAGIKADEISRGQELATPGYLQPTQRLVVQLRSLPSSSVVLKDRLEVNLHLGTKEAPARIILKGKRLQPGQRCYAEIRTQDPVVASYGQRFIIRRISPALTIGGGTILDPLVAAEKRIKDLEAHGAALDTPSEYSRLSFLLSQQDVIDDSPLPAAHRAGILTRRYAGLIEELKKSGDLLTIGSAERPCLVHRDRLKSVAGSVLRTIRAEVQKHQPRRRLPRNTLITACRKITRPDLLDAVLHQLQKTKQLVEIRGQIGPADLQVTLTKNQQQALSKMLEALIAGGLTPPTVKALTADLGQKPDQIQLLLNLCVEDGLLVRISDELYFVPEALEAARARCQEYLQENAEATMSQLREAWKVSRKFSVPLCEYFDVAGVTVRQGDVRVVGPNISQPLQL